MNTIDNAINAYLVSVPFFGDYKRSWFLTKRLLDYTNHCAFCTKNKTDVKNLIALPYKMHVCNECVELMVDIIAEEDLEKLK